VAATKSRGKAYYYYQCQNYNRGVHGAGCAGNIAMAGLDTQIWAKVWKAMTEKRGEFQLALEARIAELQAQEADAETECARLQEQLDGLLMERQKVITQWRKGKMTDTDYDLQLGALTIEQAGVEKDLSTKSLLAGNQAEHLIAIANRYRADTARGMAGLNDAPKTAEHALKQFETRRKYIDGLVVRADVQADKTPLVTLEIDLSELLRISKPIAACHRR
jgi:chromosome segregation ATPase